MSVKIRFRRQGRKNRAFFRLVVTDSRRPRDGEYIESLGWYNPFHKEGTPSAELNSERIAYWLKQGAQLNPKAKSLVKRLHPDVLVQS